MKIELPQVGESVTEGVIGKWLKQVGDRVEKYDTLVEVVTDKVSMELPSPVSGVLVEVLVEEGQTVPMGAAIAEIRVEGEEEAGVGQKPAPAPSTAGAAALEAIDRTGVLLKDAAPVGPTGSGGPLLPTEEASTSAQDVFPAAREDVAASQRADVASRQDASAHGARRLYSPAVLRLAEEASVELSQVIGTGIGGRVTRKDVQSYLASAQSAVIAEPASTEATVAAPEPEEERVPLTPVRRMIAEHMVKSATEIPQAWSIVEVDVTGLVQRREGAKSSFLRREGVNLTYLPFVVKAVAESLNENPVVNSSWGGDAIIMKRRVNIGVAVAAPDGLVVPVVHDADALSIAALAKVIDDLTNRARRGRLILEDVRGGTFTVNNTGALGSVVSQPLINYPQAAIITTEAIVKRPVVINDAIAVRSMMNLCLAFDHRVLDGSEAGAFINAVKHRLEAMGPETAIY